MKDQTAESSPIKMDKEQNSCINDRMISVSALPFDKEHVDKKEKLRQFHLMNE